MDPFRHYTAMVLTVSMPPLLLYWCLLHPWVGFWRRFGPMTAMVTIWSVVLMGMAAIFAIRERLLAVDFGTSLPLFAAGTICLAVAGWLGLKLMPQLRFKTLCGLPELAPERYPQRLLTEGPYAWVRHPRYLQMLLGLLGWSMLANHAASYVACALWLPGAWIIVRWEERELRQRFGEAYRIYCLHVPRWIPAWRQEGKPGHARGRNA